MNDELLRGVWKHGIPRISDSIWQYGVIATPTFLYTFADFRFLESEDGLPEWVGIFFLIAMQHSLLQEVLHKRLRRLRNQLNDVEEELWITLKKAAIPDWRSLFLQAFAIGMLVMLYVEHGFFDYSDRIGAYDWVIWLFIGWMGTQTCVRVSSTTKVETAYYKWMYKASTSRPDE